jgi:DNA polymerase elongation subunit (family B)
MKTNDPLKRLTLDIETSPMDLRGFGIRDQTFGLNQIMRPTRMLSFAAKWYDSDEVFVAADFDNDPDDHYEMVTKAWDLINEAYMVIHYNGKSFDMKHLNREFHEAKLGPARPYQYIDLYRVVKRYFYLPSYKLDYVLTWLNLDNKVSTGGFATWNKVMAGDKEAQELFLRYNIGDVTKTELVYTDILPWIDDHPNAQLFVPRGDNPSCPTCFSEEVVKDGFAPRGNLARVQCYRCKNCGRSFRGSDVVIRAKER